MSRRLRRRDEPVLAERTALAVRSSARQVVCQMRSRRGATATTQRDKRNVYATTRIGLRGNAVKPLFSGRFARAADDRLAIADVSQWDPAIQIRKTSRGNCW